MEVFMTIYDIVVKDDKGRDVSLSEYKGKTLLIVNTATGCGFTPQYAGLERLYETYRDKGLVVLDFPCNQFGSQAPGTIDEINQFCTLRYNTTFPRFAKIEVNGANESPLYAFLKSQKKGFVNAAIKWNFTKFLVDKDGVVTARFAPADTPESLEKAVAKLCA
jgi:glutathione peroxidase